MAAKKPVAKKAGRPTKRTPELLAQIGKRLGEGEPLAAICRDVKLDPSTVWDWMQADDEISQSIARARDEGEQAIAHRLRATARGVGESTGDIQRDKLIIDTDLKLLAKWNPKKYGEKQSLEVSGKLSLAELVQASNE